MKFNSAFSLLELMVVVGIIGLLATVAAPYYVDYSNKSKVALAALVLNNLNTKAMALYNEGQIFPGMTSLTIDGITIADGGFATVNYPPVTSITFLAPGDGYMSNNEWMFCAYVDGLSFSGYTGAGGGYSRLCSKVVFNSGIFTTYCGCWDPNSTLEIPQQYLPDQCNVANVSAY